MKLLNQLFLATIVSLTFACSSSTTNETEDEKTSGSTEQPKGMKQIDLRGYELNAIISVPDDSKGKAEATPTDWGSIIINVADWYAIEIIPFGISIEEKKAELSADLVYTIDYLIDEESLIMYKKTIAESDIDPEYHFFMTKEIDGQLIEVKSIGDQSFTKKEIETMIISAKSFSQITDV